MITDDEAYQWLAENTGIEYKDAKRIMSKATSVAREERCRQEQEVGVLRKKLEDVEKQAALVDKIDAALQENDSVIARQGIQALLNVAWYTNGSYGHFGRCWRLFDWLSEPSWMHEPIIRAMITILEDDLIVGHDQPIAGVAQKIGFPVEITLPAMSLARELEALRMAGAA